MLIKNIALITGLTVSAVTASGAFTQANAAIFNVGGINYDVTTIDTSFNASSSLLQSQPWWGNETLATTFAATVADSLGLPNFFGSFGPYFAYSLDNDRVNAKAFDSTDVNADINSTFTFATATAVNPTTVP